MIGVTPEEIQRLRELIATATPGPWEPRYDQQGYRQLSGPTSRVASILSAPDAALIAEMRNRFSDLLDTVEDYHSLTENHHALCDTVMAMSRDVGDKPLQREALVVRNPSTRRVAFEAEARLRAMDPATLGPAARRLLNTMPDLKDPPHERRPDMSTIVVTGHSDDLIEIDGDIREEFTYTGDEEDNLLGFSDGTILRITFGGPWRISIVHRGSADFSLVQAPEDDDENYSDKATLSGDISWVVHGIGWAK